MVVLGYIVFKILTIKNLAIFLNVNTLNSFYQASFKQSKCGKI
jgi:hypothetical protein